MEETVSQIVALKGYSRKTLSQACQRGYLGHAVRMEGKTYWIDRAHPDYLAWEAAHAVQPRVRGNASKQIS